MSLWFITATGTDIGKTVLTTALCRQLQTLGHKVRALKPVLSGYTPVEIDDSDSGRILASLGVTPTDDYVAAITPWRFAAPLSPDMAAAREGQTIDFDALATFCAPGDEDILLVEGVGGAMVPLTEDKTVLDWIIALNAPALVVTGSYLGAISHTLTTVAAMRARGAAIAAVVVSESLENPVPLAETVETMQRFLTPIPVFPMARSKSPVVSDDLIALMTTKTAKGSINA
jgi:dethiobiotin synthetase